MPARLLIWLRSSLGIRLRSAIAAAAVVALALTVAGVALVTAARTMLISDINATIADKANEVIGALSTGNNDQLAQTLLPSAGERTIVQVLDATGQVIAASEDISGKPAMSPLRPEGGQTLREQREVSVTIWRGHVGDETAEPQESGELFSIVAVGTQTTNGAYVVLVGQSQHSAEKTSEVVRGILVVGLPLLTLIIGAATFWFVGRALRPVEAMRQQAITISATNLHTRLPVPRAHDEIAALATTMNDMLTRIEAASQSQRRFVADASHELRSPLSTIHAGLDLLSRTDLPQMATTHVARMRAESGRMAVLIDDLLFLARFDEHGPNTRRDDVDLDDLAYAERDRIASLRPDIHVEDSIMPVRVLGDTHLLQRAVRNLVDNAIRYARSTVTVTLSATATTAHLSIGNDGPTIPPDDRERIFERFVRLDDSRSRSDGGAGLGLSITREIVAAHSGTLTVTDLATGDGSAFHIHLPVTV